VNIELIVDEIDAEIEKLQRIQAILKRLLSPRPQMVAKPRPARVKRLPQIADQPEPGFIVLPPKQRREYTPRAKPILIEPRALAAPANNRPVFVPKAAVRRSEPAKVAGVDSRMEAVMRRKLLDGAA
jgi:hypothetical protein